MTRSERQLIHQELVGVVAKVVDEYLEYATRPGLSSSYQQRP